MFLIFLPFFDNFNKKMAALSLPAEFRKSYLHYDSYPLNLILNGTKAYRSTLELYKARLDANEANLCLPNEKYIHVPIRKINHEFGTFFRSQYSSTYY